MRLPQIAAVRESSLSPGAAALQQPVVAIFSSRFCRAYARLPPACGAAGAAAAAQAVPARSGVWCTSVTAAGVVARSATPSAARKCSASSAAIQPIPALVTACR